MSGWIKAGFHIAAVYASIYLAFLAASTGWSQGHETVTLHSDLRVLERCKEIITDKEPRP